MHRRTYLFLFIGVLAASALGITTEQIWQNVYDSANVAARVNVVVGGGGGGATPTPQPTPTPLTFGANGVVAIFGSPELQPYPGFTPATGFVTALSASGVPTLATPVPPTPVSTPTPQPTATPLSPQYRSTIYTGGTAGLSGAGGNNFLGLGTMDNQGATETTQEDPQAIAFTASNLSCWFSVAPAGGTSWTVTLRTGACGGSLSDSSLACTLTGNGTLVTCTDNSHSAAISANQCASLNAVGTGTPANSLIHCSTEGDF